MKSDKRKQKEGSVTKELSFSTTDLQEKKKVEASDKS